MNIKNVGWTVLVGVMAAGVALAGEPTLNVGDRAPKLQTGKWVQGDPVKQFEQGKAYIVEFWATWCGPCRATIPHLNEIYKKFADKGLVVIGQDCWERDESLVKPFVEKMGDKMTYRVALDDKEGSERGKMAETWMAAAGRNGIPSAFLVDTKGFIAWIGHPMQLKEALIEQVLAGTFDLKKAAASYERARQNEEKIQKTWTEMNQAMRQKNWDQAEAKLAEAGDLLPEDERPNLDVTRLRILFGKEDYDGAYKLVKKISDANEREAGVQNQLAWQIATDPAIKQRDLKLADLCANRANAAVKGGDPSILDTVARVKFMLGQKAEAVELQQKAVGLADSNLKGQLERTLESYKRGELPKAD
jgi:thiol-disulfide isomerase/thioredoxin